MAALQASGNLSLSELVSHFVGGSKLSDFYRGGGLVPSTRTTTTYGSTQGPYYWWPSAVADYAEYEKSSKYLSFYWSGALKGTLYTQYTGGADVSWIFGDYEYTSGTTVEFEDATYKHFSISRRLVTTENTSINTGIPTSGTLSLSHFYGAQNS